MSELATQLRTHIEAAAAPVTAAEIIAGARGEVTPIRRTADRRPWWRSPLATAAAATLSVLAVVGGVVVGLRALIGGDDVARVEGAIEPGLGVAVPIGEMPRALVAVDGDLYLIIGDATIVRFDPGAAAITGELADAAEWTGDLGGLAGDLWFGAGPTLGRIDPTRMEITDTIELGRREAGPIAVGHGSLWASVFVDQAADPDAGLDAERSGPHVLRIDPVTGEIIATIPITGAVPEGSLGTAGVADLVATAGSVWVATDCDGCRDYATFQQIDPATNRVTRVVVWQVGDRSQTTSPRLVVVDGRLWGAIATIITNDDDRGELVEGGLYRITENGRVELRASLGRWPQAAGYARGSVWITDCLDGTLIQIDPATGAVQGSPHRIGIPLTGEMDVFDPEGYTCPSSLAVLGDTLWVTGLVDGTLIPVYLDPANAPGPTVTLPGSEPAEGLTTTPSGPETTGTPDTTAVDTAPGAGEGDPPPEHDDEEPPPDDDR